MPGLNKAFSNSFEDNLFDQFSLHDIPARIARLPEKLSCMDCDETGETYDFAEAVAWNLEHINRHHPQPELTIVIGSSMDAPKRKRVLLSRDCHLCGGVPFSSEDSLRSHVKRQHKILMPEFRASAPAQGETAA